MCLPQARLAFGEVDVSWKTVAFKKIKFSTRENVGYGTVDLPGPESAHHGLLADSVTLASAEHERSRLSAQ